MKHTETEGMIYLSNARGCSRNEWYRSYYTLNFGGYQLESRKPFGNLIAVNDDTLKDGRTLIHSISEDTTVILLPLIGKLSYKSSISADAVADVGQAHTLYLPSHSSLEISNPYSDELINFLQLWFTFKRSLNQDAEAQTMEFDIAGNPNSLIGIHRFNETEGGPLQVLIGKYDGRKSGKYVLKNTHKRVFVFVIEGAFEVQERLLQSRDGLSLWNTTEIEFEALSNEAIILVIDL